MRDCGDARERLKSSNTTGRCTFCLRTFWRGSYLASNRPLSIHALAMLAPSNLVYILP